MSNKENTYRCKCCKKTLDGTTADRLAQRLEDNTYSCSPCFFGHDEGETGHAPRRFCSCCKVGTDPTSMYGFFATTSGLCRHCPQSRCKPGGPHVETVRDKGSPAVHRHLCVHCQHWFFCDCHKGESLANPSCCSSPPTDASGGGYLHTHSCSRCQDVFRCLLDDQGSRSACGNCRAACQLAVDRGTQFKSVKSSCHPPPVMPKPTIRKKRVNSRSTSAGNSAPLRLSSWAIDRSLVTIQDQRDPFVSFLVAVNNNTARST